MVDAGRDNVWRMSLGWWDLFMTRKCIIECMVIQGVDLVRKGLFRDPFKLQARASSRNFRTIASRYQKMLSNLTSLNSWSQISKDQQTWISCGSI